ncbi:uncharacterized protein SCDLUD_002301 [Saccharomycodes ludwigii]|uniref:uncharacterized protein n=1 Tax=Saccharomycodes ludwigii TaxID=36035 RepID=UPI001E838BA7|nr:hypothetical protein SCDLUD_002301 [Saccharomycodes ludwigii]KAH3900847.1 hypothetical protein SCDLUD_002301 [Saccharomycodes ludwigii]
MEYSLKAENRKKFKDKQKLKRKHATPSDLKYHKINTTDAAGRNKIIIKNKNNDEDNKENKVEETEKEVSQLQDDNECNNIAKNDILLEQVEDDVIDDELRKKLKEIALEKSVNDNTNDADRISKLILTKDKLTYKDFDKMNVTQLNQVLAKNKGVDVGNVSDTITSSGLQSSKIPEPIITDEAVVPNGVSIDKENNSMLPNTLLDDQSFLDSIL